MATGIPLIDIPLWLLGLEVGGGREVRFALELEPPGSNLSLLDASDYGPMGPCLQCGGPSATTKNRFGEPVCEPCKTKP